MHLFDKKIKEPAIVVLTEPEEVAEIANAIIEAKPQAIGIDTETTGLHLRKDRIAIVSWYSPAQIKVPQLGGKYISAAFVTFGPVLGVTGTLEALRPMLESDIPKVGSNISGFDYFMFRNHNIIMREPIYDTIFMNWLFDENRKELGLKQAMYDFYGYSMRTFEDAAQGALMDYWNWDFDRLKAYAGLDGWSSYLVYRFLHTKLKRKRLPTGKTLWDMYIDYIYPLQAIIREMNSSGVQIDAEQLVLLGEKLQKERDEAARELQRIMVKAALRKGIDWAGIINPRSTPQLRRLFFEILDAPKIKWGKAHARTGEQHASLDRSVLEKYAERDDAVGIAAQCVLNYRAIDKLMGTYVGNAEKKTGLLYKIEDGRVYPSFKLGTVTGRFACKDPNLQNIPARGKLGKEIRKAFIASEGYKLIVADYSQLELCLLAHFSEASLPEEQRTMCNALLSGEDLHCRTASIMYDVPYEDIYEAKRKSDAEEKISIAEEELLRYRTAAKTISYGLIYGMGPDTLAKRLKVSKEEAESLIELYFSAYPSARKWIEDVISTCEKRGEVWTLLGRPRRLREIHSPDKEVKARAKRQAVNSVIQGSAADVMYIAMISLFKDEKLRSWGMRMLMQVHDEVVLEVKEEFATQALHRTTSLMEIGREEGLAIDLEVSAHIGNSWADAK